MVKITKQKLGLVIGIVCIFALVITITLVLTNKSLPKFYVKDFMPDNGGISISYIKSIPDGCKDLVWEWNHINYTNKCMTGDDLLIMMAHAGYKELIIQNEEDYGFDIGYAYTIVGEKDSIIYVKQE